jgi:chorismate dehydratase
MTKKPIIGSVPYLNAKPLIHWFETPEGKSSGVEVIEAPPSQLARMLDDDEIDVAMVSSFEAFRKPDLVHVPGISISGQDEIKSVRAFSRVPFNMAQTVAMDTSSLTSVALLTILLVETYNNHPQHLAMPPNLQQMLSVADACLLIGDPGMLADGTGLQTLDLGSGWRKLTGLPFVYALWLGKPDRVTPQIIDALQTAKAYGLTQLDEIADLEAKRLCVPHSVTLDYITNVMDYNLDDNLLKGLETFREKVFANNLLGSSRIGNSNTRVME